MFILQYPMEQIKLDIGVLQRTDSFEPPTIRRGPIQKIVIARAEHGIVVTAHTLQGGGESGALPMSPPSVCTKPWELRALMPKSLAFPTDVRDEK